MPCTELWQHIVQLHNPTPFIWDFGLLRRGPAGSGFTPHPYKHRFAGGDADVGGSVGHLSGEPTRTRPRGRADARGVGPSLSGLDACSTTLTDLIDPSMVSHGAAPRSNARKSSEWSRVKRARMSSSFRVSSVRRMFSTSDGLVVHAGIHGVDARCGACYKEGASVRGAVR